MLQSFFRNTSGATTIEYGMIGVIISITVFAGAHLIGFKLVNYFEPISNALN